MSKPSPSPHLQRLLRTQPFRWLLGSLKGQIFVLFTVTFISVCTLTLMDFWDLTRLKRHLLLEDRYYELLNNVLEVRRYEKNYLLYKNPANLVEGGRYLKKIDSLVLNLTHDIVTIASRDKFEEFRGVLVGYEQTHNLFLSHGKAAGDFALMRNRGRELTDFASLFLRIKQRETRKTIENVMFLPFAFLGVFFLLMLLVIRLVSLGLLRPLKMLQTTIQNMAKGGYSPVGYPALQTDEMRELIGAFDKMARELEDHQEHLLQARKMAALGAFTAGIAHELNNPLNNISLTAETYLEEYEDRMDGEAKELLGDILAQSQRACDIVKDLLNFSRTEQIPSASIDAREIIRTTVELIKNQISSASVKLDLRIDQVSRPVRGTMRSLQQVFSNLLLNALQAMPNGGTITVELKEQPPDLVRFDIRDTGTGIAPEKLEHIFEPFFTTKDPGRGTGLGLALVYSIVKRHGGRIEVDSRLGGGTVFSVLLPAADARVETATPQQERSQNAACARGDN